jgi:hypothetical protein
LINGEQSVSGTVLLTSNLIVVVLLLRSVVESGLKLLEVILVSVGVVVSTDDAGVGRNNLAVLDNNLHHESVAVRRIW